MKTKCFDSSISIIRVIAMLSIVFGHICTWMDINLYQLGGIGVEIFLLISGYLYGNKEIPNKAMWLGDRVKKVMVPFWILVICLSLYMVFCGDILDAVLQLLETGLNLQGIGRILLYPMRLGNLHLPGLSHCWFLTVIMVCYGLTAVLKGGRVEKFVDEHAGGCLVAAVLLQLVLVFAGVQLSYILQYFLGYFYSRWQQRPGTEKKRRALYIWTTVITAIACVGRLLARRYVDGTVCYDHFVARISFNALGFWLYLTMSAVCKRLKQSEALAASWLWKRLDALSYSVFLVHYMFMKAPFAAEGYISAPWGQVCAALILTLVSALVLERLTALVNCWLAMPRKAGKKLTVWRNEGKDHG